jgi:hypothetical protein
MPYLISKADTPNAQYTRMMYHGEVVMMTVTQNGPVMMFTDIGENLFVPWDEIIEFAATSENRKLLEEPKEPLKEPEKQERKPQVREVQPKK